MAGNPNPDTSGLTPWPKGVSGNPNGRPRKLVSSVIQQLGEEGIEHVTKGQVRGCIEVLLNCTRDEIMALSKDEEQSMIIRIVARHLIKGGDNERVLNMLLDRAFGRPSQSIDHQSSDGSMSPPQTFADLYDELEIEEAKKKLNGKSES